MSALPSFRGLETTGTPLSSCQSSIRTHVVSFNKTRADAINDCRFIDCLAACFVIWFFVDVKKGRAQAIAFSIEERGLTAEVRPDQAEGAVAEK